jgi:hypothetical protein
MALGLDQDGRSCAGSMHPGASERRLHGRVESAKTDAVVFGFLDGGKAPGRPREGEQPRTMEAFHRDIATKNAA